MSSARTDEDVVKELDDRAGAITAGEIDHVVVAIGRSEVRVSNNSNTAAFDATSAVRQLKGGGRRGENAAAHDERGRVERKILLPSVAKGKVIEA